MQQRGPARTRRPCARSPQPRQSGGVADSPALILTIGENGKIGYVESSELNRRPLRGASQAARSIAGWDKEANQRIDTLTAKPSQNPRSAISVAKSTGSELVY